ncbi:MAG: TrmH family RNA methyltransferase [Pseudomonadota bacterium]
MRLALFQPDMAPNVGAAIRLAACFGVPLDIIEPCGFPLTSRDIRRVAMDYEDLAEVTRHTSWADFEAFIERDKLRLILMTTRASEPIWDHRFGESDVVLMGRESSGAPDAVHTRAHNRLFIPMTAQARSLNLVVSAGIVLGEASRQLGLDGMGRA